jgi:lipopolysaccharide/colanic/teichoic acid biosynthesis glycosyltransferase
MRIFDTIKIQQVDRTKINYYRLKRSFDLVCATILLIIFFPVFLIIAFLVVLDSTGPVFFLQERVGGNWITQGDHYYWIQSLFTCYKFRTMTHRANPTLHHDYIKAFINNDLQKMSSIQGEDIQINKLVHDPRITRIGRILRKCSLDELPQLINVFKGEMSLVGPRPAIPYEVKEYKFWHHARLDVQPGMTGLWQVTARSSSDFDEMVRLDIKYIKEQSFKLDLIILLKTPLVVIKCDGAF